MDHADAVAAIACIPGVTQEMVDAIEGGMADAERARLDALYEAQTARADLHRWKTKVEILRARLSVYEAREAAYAAANPLPF